MAKAEAEQEAEQEAEKQADAMLNDGSIDTHKADDELLKNGTQEDLRQFLNGESGEKVRNVNNVDKYLEEEIVEKNGGTLLERVLGDNCVLRLAIAAVFVNKYGMERNEDEWDGRKRKGKRIIPNIRNDLDLPDAFKLRHILREVIKCADEGKVYDGKPANMEGRKKKVIIKEDSEEAQLIADVTEFGGSHRQAWRIVNKHRREEGLPSLTQSAVSNLIRRLKPKLESVTTRKQGSSCDKNSRICRARKLWCIQLAIVFGLIDFEEFKKDHEDFKNDATPPWFDKTKLTKINKYDIVWWDEVHRQCASLRLRRRRHPFTVVMLMES